MRTIQSLWRCCAATLLLGLCGIATAQQPQPLPQVEDTLRVARLAGIEGQVSIFREADEGWSVARLNAPIQSENSIWTEGSARADVRLGASALRFDHDTVFDFLRMDLEQTLGYLQRGAVQVRVRTYRENDFADKFAIDTPNGRATFESDGRYRVDVNPTTQETRVTVFSGRARFEQGSSRLAIEAGRELQVRGQGHSVEIRYFMAQDTALDRWAEARDARWDRSHARIVRESVVSPYMTGYEELDEYGEWIDDREYGRVWAPRVVSSGWAPYRYGHWAWVRPWGWTWVDDAPWGFAPFHYGRWVTIRNRWCWWPGHYHPRPAYAPALVAWFGSGGAGLSISRGPHVGWFPLAPREHFVPRYPHSAIYANNINFITGNVTITPPPHYRNHRHGATFVANDVFIGSRPVGGQYVNRPPANAFNAPISHHADIRPHPVRPPGQTSGQSPSQVPGQLPGQLPDRRPPPVAHGDRPPAFPPGQAIPTPRQTHPTYKPAPEAIISGPAPQPPAPPRTPAEKRPPEAIVVGPAIAPAHESRTLLQPTGPSANPGASVEQPQPGPRIRGRRQPAPESAPVPAAPILVPHGSPPAISAPSSPSVSSAPVPPAVHRAPNPKPKGENSAKPKDVERDASEKPRGERNAHPKAAIQ